MTFRSVLSEKSSSLCSFGLAIGAEQRKGGQRGQIYLFIMLAILAIPIHIFRLPVP